MLALNPARECGFTLLESTIAAGICALFLGSLFTLNTVTMDMVRVAREEACASQVLQQRVEAMRIANWHQITDATWIKTNLLQADAPGSGSLKDFIETLTLAPYGTSGLGNSTKLTRSNGSAEILFENTALLAENAVKVVWTIDFSRSPNGRPRNRQTVAILAKGGVAK